MGQEERDSGTLMEPKVHCVRVWPPHLNKGIVELEKVQKRTSKRWACSGGSTPGCAMPGMEKEVEDRGEEGNMKGRRVLSWNPGKWKAGIL